MRTRLKMTFGCVGVLTIVLTVAAAPVGAAPQQGVHNGNATNTEQGAQVAAGSFYSGNPGEHGTGSGGSIDMDCGWYLEGGGVGAGGFGLGGDFSVSELNDILESSPNDTIRIQYQCYTPTGASFGEPYYVDYNGDPLSLGVDFPPDPADLIDPFELAEQAVNELVLPIPHIETSPSIEDGTYAQLPTYLAMLNWDEVGPATATAGPVVVEVVANPVQQTWTIYDRYRDETVTTTCAGPGGTAEAEGGCAWTPEHSSAGQPNGNEWQDEATGEPCFYAEVMVQWEMTWTVDGAPGEPALAPGFSAGSTCLVVAEVQAIVDTG